MTNARAAVVIVLIFVLAALSQLAIAAGYRINTTDSMPVGLWRIEPPPEVPARGMAVIFCFPPPPPHNEAATAALRQTGGMRQRPGATLEGNHRRRRRHDNRLG